MTKLIVKYVIIHISAIIKHKVVFAQTDAYIGKIMDSLEIVGLNYPILFDGEIVHHKLSEEYT